jgi:hypothetical protein
MELEVQIEADNAIKKYCSTQEPRINMTVHSLYKHLSKQFHLKKNSIQ